MAAAEDTAVFPKGGTLHTSVAGWEGATQVRYLGRPLPPVDAGAKVPLKERRQTAPSEHIGYTFNRPKAKVRGPTL